MLEVKRQQERESWQKIRADSKDQSMTEIIAHKSSESMSMNKMKVIPLPAVKENQAAPAVESSVGEIV